MEGEQKKKLMEMSNLLLEVFCNFLYMQLKQKGLARLMRKMLGRRQGQDFAHLMLGLCRIHKIPARYVSGYFLNQHKLPGEIEASHAWIEVFIPNYGWKGSDPTHQRVPDTRYVKLATGRDYGDIRPVGGTFRGKGTRKMVVEVSVHRVG